MSRFLSKILHFILRNATIHKVIGMKKQRILRLCIYAGGAAALIAIFYLLAQNGIGIGCLFQKVTGLQCPGCGNSRAAIALMQLDFSAALGYNLLFPLEYGYILWVLYHSSVSYVKTGRFSYQMKWIWLDASVLALVFLWGIVRNMIGM